MKTIITRFTLDKLQIPAGRTIGDSMCHYDAYRAVALRLETNDGLVGWGFGEKAHGGEFAKEASWNRPLAPVHELTQIFESTYWGDLEGRTPTGARLAAGAFGGDSALALATRMALWDLVGKEAGLPLYKLLGGTHARSSIRAYASACEFQQPDQFLRDFYAAKVRDGFRAFKIKVGHPDPDHDLRRLLIMREVIGAESSLAVDANKAWTAQETMERVAYFNKHGVNLAYIEDPLDPGDLEGYRRLGAESLAVVGHDYVPIARALRPLLETGALLMVRARDGLDYGLELLPLAREFAKPVICCNTLFEWNIHFALAFPQVDRIEFADLGWNQLPKTPIRIADGMMFPPEVPGHGFEPEPHIFEQWKI